MSASKIIRAGLALLGIAATVSGHDHIIPADQSNFSVEDNPAWPKINQDTLRLVTVFHVAFNMLLKKRSSLQYFDFFHSCIEEMGFPDDVMRHGERAPADTYPNDPYVNDTMEPFGWGQLTNKGRRNVYLTGHFLRRRYGGYLGDTYNPNKFWLQTSSIDRTKMTGLILSAALWKPNEYQAFLPYVDWQPVSLHYWERPEDRLLIIWNACPRLTLERMQVENSTKVRLVNRNNKRLYEELENQTGLPINGAADVASLYSTLKAEVAMELPLPEWTKAFFPERVESIACFSLSMNVFTDNLRKLAGGPLVTKIVKSMIAKSLGKLKPEERKMFTFVGHDSTLVNMLSAMKVWNGRDPDFGCMIMIELHEIDGTYNVQLFQKNLATEEPYSLTVPDCGTVCPLDKFVHLMGPVMIDDYDADCRVDDPHYEIPPQPPA